MLRAGCGCSLLSRQRAALGWLSASMGWQSYCSGPALMHFWQCPRYLSPPGPGCVRISLPQVVAAAVRPRNPWQPASQPRSPTGAAQAQAQSCLLENSNCALGLCFHEGMGWIHNVPRATGMALLYFHKEVSPNCTRAVFLQRNLFPPKADSHGSPCVCVCVCLCLCVCAGGAALWQCLYVSCLRWWNYCLFF